MKRILLLLVLLSPLVLSAQNITVTSAQGQNITTFVEQHLKGNGVYITNVKFNNVQGNITFPQIGTFNSNGFPHLQMDQGVVLTTGNVSLAPGPNNNGGATAAVTSHYTDPMTQMAALVSNPLTSCATIDFDFVSISPFVTLNYCFGSEEYDEYVWSSFNDVFAFFVTGPDPTSPTHQSMTKNIAIIPHTISAAHPNGIAVAINTVNGKTEAENPSAGHYHYSEFYVHNDFPTGVQYDAFTQKLSANATLLPCEQYHMHISICNVSDKNLDSGVFLEESSFNSPSADVNLSQRVPDTIERSQPVEFTLTLANTYYNFGRVVVGFGGTAVVGEDYSIVTDSNQTVSQQRPFFYIDDGYNSLIFSGLPTANLRSPKTIELYLTTSLCPARPELKTYDTIRYVLVEDDVLRLRDTTIVAYDTCRQVGVEVVLGEPTTFRWIPEDGIDFPRQQYSSAIITESRNYRVAAADGRGHVDTANVTIEVRETPQQGVEELSPDEGFRIYPNPSTGMFNVEAGGIILVQVYDVRGAQVYERHCDGHAEVLNISPLPAGLYTVRVTTSVGVKTEKVVVR
ncbi:MAG: T9SS type A sorting domain-containing protein [Bacteroidales bacterium]|nr:T9SS type A sorting domain-containing protein [Bacteroidales bacterium]